MKKLFYCSTIFFALTFNTFSFADVAYLAKEEIYKMTNYCEKKSQNANSKKFCSALRTGNKTELKKICDSNKNPQLASWGCFQLAALNIMNQDTIKTYELFIKSCDKRGIFDGKDASRACVIAMEIFFTGNKGKIQTETSSKYSKIFCRSKLSKSVPEMREIRTAVCHN